MESILGKGLRAVRAALALSPRIILSHQNLPARYQSTNQSSLVHDQQGSKNVIDSVNNVIERKEEGRLFAVVQVCGKQFKVTDNDIIVVEGYWPPDIGDALRLEKVLLAGAKDFTLIGRPILPLNQVSVKATVIEKSLTHTKVQFRYIKRKQYKNMNFLKFSLTYLRINSIQLLGKVNELGDVDGNEDRVF